MASTGIADTRLLLTLEFPPDEETRDAIQGLVQRELGSKLLAPAVVLTEFVKFAGARIGKDAARTRLSLLKDRGMRPAPIGEREALAAGDLLLAHRDAPTADALIASFVVSREGDYVLSDDPHYRELGVKTKWITPPPRRSSEVGPSKRS
ncbi:MAG: PIN domain-containing protein [Nitrososphaerota archaeon]|nr:PIN domain-containing protein [Nitrososphaerota archaeon]